MFLQNFLNLSQTGGCTEFCQKFKMAAVFHLELSGVRMSQVRLSFDSPQIRLGRLLRALQVFFSFIQVRTNRPPPLFFTSCDPLVVDVGISTEKLDVYQTDLTTVTFSLQHSGLSQ